jgi:hypothetical protein
MSIKEYDYSIEDPINFMDLMKKELEYDVWQEYFDI